MSPRAAWQLERMGFEAFDYVGGKADWLAAGMPTERAHPPEGRRAIDAADRHPPTCSPDAAAADLPEGDVVVVGPGGVVLGRVRAEAERPPGARAGDVMEAGPTTVRADSDLDDLLGRMAAKDVAEVLVTTPQGVLLGVVRREVRTPSG